jgi:hypothetical protein
VPIADLISGSKSPMDAFLERMDQEKKNQLVAAQAKREQARANLPFGGEMPPGPAGQTIGLEMVKGQYGENSPQYQQAKKMYDLNQQSTQSRVDYQNILSGTAPKRFSTNLGKTAQELEDVRNGYLPGTQIPLSPEQQKYYEGKYGLAMLKPTTDSDTRKRNLYAKNIDITVAGIDPKALTQYSGIEGMGNLLKERAAAQNGKASPAYLAYETSLTNAKTLAKQVRQFYGDSITPSVQEGLKELTNPSKWLKSPEVALNNYNTFVKTLRSEMGTYQQATESPDVYAGNSQQQNQDISPPPQTNAAPPPMNPAMSPPVSNPTEPPPGEEHIIPVYKKGKTYNIPARLLNKAMKDGFSTNAD